MRVISLRPTIDKYKVGTVEFEIAKGYQTLKKTVEKKGYDRYTLALFQKELKEHYDDNVKMYVPTEEDKKSSAQEAFQASQEAFYAGQGNQKKFHAKFTGNCNHCGITGHREADCNKKKRELAAQQGQWSNQSQWNNQGYAGRGFNNNAGRGPQGYGNNNNAGRGYQFSNQNQGHGYSNNAGRGFQGQGQGRGNGGRFYTCYNCGQPGHLSQNC